MTENRKKKNWYLIFTIVNLVLSLAQYLIFTDISVEQRLETALAINGGYHIMYCFTGYIPRFQLFMIGEKNSIYRKALLGLKIYAYLFVVTGIGMLGYIVYNTIFVEEFQQIGVFGLGMPFSLILGGLSSLKYIQMKQMSIDQSGN